MEFIDIPTEQTTAATDLLLALVALASILYLARMGERDRWKVRIWEFDFNGIFHLFQIAGVVVLVAGLRAALRAPHAEGAVL